MASFISSDGWMPNELNPIQRLEPPELVPMPGTSTASSSTIVTMTRIPLSFRQRR